MKTPYKDTDHLLVFVVHISDGWFSGHSTDLSEEGGPHFSPFENNSRTEVTALFFFNISSRLQPTGEKAAGKKPTTAGETWYEVDIRNCNVSCLLTHKMPWLNTQITACMVDIKGLMRELNELTQFCTFCSK